MNNRNFTPRLSSGALPDLTSYTVADAESFQSAIERWVDSGIGYRDLLYARVFGGELTPAFDEIVKGRWGFQASPAYFKHRATRKRIGDREWVRLRDEFTDAMYAPVIAVCDSMFAREITLHDWSRQMAGLVRDTHCALWLLGVGGYNNVDSSSVLTLNDTLRIQMEYLTAFTQAIVDGNRPDADVPLFDFGSQRQHISLYTPRTMQRQGVVNRSTLYVESGTQSAERGKVVSYRRFTDELPEYPGDGNQICQMRCRCHWRFQFLSPDPGYYYAFWRLNFRAKHCRTCLQNAAQWSPLTVRRF